MLNYIQIQSGYLGISAAAEAIGLKQYQTIEIEIILFANEDVITASVPVHLPEVPVEG